eukprot:g20018.t1
MLRMYGYLDWVPSVNPAHLKFLDESSFRNYDLYRRRNCRSSRGRRVVLGRDMSEHVDVTSNQTASPRSSARVRHNYGDRELFWLKFTRAALAALGVDPTYDELAASIPAAVKLQLGMRLQAIITESVQSNNDALLTVKRAGRLPYETAYALLSERKQEFSDASKCIDLIGKLEAAKHLPFGDFGRTCYWNRPDAAKPHFDALVEMACEQMQALAMLYGERRDSSEPQGLVAQDRPFRGKCFACNGPHHKLPYWSTTSDVWNRLMAEVLPSTNMSRAGWSFVVTELLTRSYNSGLRSSPTKRWPTDKEGYPTVGPADEPEDTDLSSDEPRSGNDDDPGWGGGTGGGGNDSGHAVGRIIRRDRPTSSRQVCNDVVMMAFEQKDVGEVNRLLQQEEIEELDDDPPMHNVHLAPTEAKEAASEQQQGCLSATGVINPHTDFLCDSECRPTILRWELLTTEQQLNENSTRFRVSVTAGQDKVQNILQIFSEKFQHY